MRRLIQILLPVLLLAPFALAQDPPVYTLPGGGTLIVKEQDSSPSVVNVREIRVTNGTLTDETGNVVSLEVGNADNLTSGTIPAARVGAGHLDALTEFAGALCGTNEILEDQGAGWACIATPMAVGTDTIGTDEIDDGAFTPLSGEYVRVNTTDQLGFEYRTSAETLADIGAMAVATYDTAVDGKADVCNEAELVDFDGDGNPEVYSSGAGFVSFDTQSNGANETARLSVAGARVMEQLAIFDDNVAVQVTSLGQADCIEYGASGLFLNLDCGGSGPAPGAPEYAEGDMYLNEANRLIADGVATDCIQWDTGLDCFYTDENCNGTVDGADVCLGTVITETDPVYSGDPAALITNAGSGIVVSAAERTAIQEVMYFSNISELETCIARDLGDVDVTCICTEGSRFDVPDGFPIQLIPANTHTNARAGRTTYLDFNHCRAMLTPDSDTSVDAVFQLNTAGLKHDDKLVIKDLTCVGTDAANQHNPNPSFSYNTNERCIDWVAGQSGQDNTACSATPNVPDLCCWSSGGGDCQSGTIHMFLSGIDTLGFTNSGDIALKFDTPTSTDFSAHFHLADSHIEGTQGLLFDINGQGNARVTVNGVFFQGIGSGSDHCVELNGNASSVVTYQSSGTRYDRCTGPVDSNVPSSTIVHAASDTFQDLGYNMPVGGGFWEIGAGSVTPGGTLTGDSWINADKPLVMVRDDAIGGSARVHFGNLLSKTATWFGTGNSNVLVNTVTGGGANQVKIAGLSGIVGGPEVCAPATLIGASGLTNLSAGFPGIALQCDGTRYVSPNKTSSFKLADGSRDYLTLDTTAANPVLQMGMDATLLAQLGYIGYGSFFTDIATGWKVLYDKDNNGSYETTVSSQVVAAGGAAAYGLFTAGATGFPVQTAFRVPSAAAQGAGDAFRIIGDTHNTARLFEIDNSAKTVFFGEGISSGASNRRALSATFWVPGTTITGSSTAFRVLRDGDEANVFLLDTANKQIRFGAAGANTGFNVEWNMLPGASAFLMRTEGGTNLLKFDLLASPNTVTWGVGSTYGLAQTVNVPDGSTNAFVVKKVTGGTELLKVDSSANTVTLTGLTATNAALTTPALGTPSSGTLTNATGLPIVAGTTGTLTIARGGTGSPTGAMPRPRTDVASGTLTVNTVNLLTTVTDPTTYSLPDSCDTATGNWVTVVVQNASTTISIDPPAEDFIVLGGLTAMDAGDKLTLSDDTESDGETITLVCLEATGGAGKWYATSYIGNWTDGGP